jgi:hypothetical protein
MQGEQRLGHLDIVGEIRPALVLLGVRKPPPGSARLSKAQRAARTARSRASITPVAS